jgi:trimeric autotransporter adhesin
MSTSRRTFSIPCAHYRASVGQPWKVTLNQLIHLAATIQRPSFPVLLFAPGLLLAATEPVNSARRDFWVPDGPVHAIVETNGIIYVGGSFSAWTPNSPKTAWLDAVSGLERVELPTIDGNIYASVPDGLGGWYVGGQFRSLNGQPRNNLARIRRDGILDPVWNPGANDVVHALTVAGGVVLVGGQFTSIAGQVRRNLAAVDVLSGEVTTWDPNVCCDAGPEQRSRILALEATDDRVYVGGFFSQAGGQPRYNIAALDLLTGAALPWPENLADPNSYVSTLRVAGQVLYVGGRFQTMDDTWRSNIAAVNADTGTVTSWDPRGNGEVNSLAVIGDILYAGGNFTSIGSATRSNIAALDLQTGLATSWDPAADNTVHRLAVSGSSIYVGGDFSNIGGSARLGLASLNTTSGRVNAWNPTGTDRFVRCLSINGKSVFVASRLVRGAVSRSGLAALEARTGRLLDWNPQTDGAVFALAVVGATVYAGGEFLHVRGEPRIRVAAIDAATGSPSPWGTMIDGPNGRIEALAASSNLLYTAGGFSAVGQVFSPGAAALDLVTGHAVAWRPISNRPVHDLIVAGDRIYAAGSFSSIGFGFRNAFAAVNAATGGASPWNPGAIGGLQEGWSMALSGNTVFVGGSFTEIGGQPRLHLAALDGTTGQATDWNPGIQSVNDSVRDMAIAGETVFVAGEFFSIGGQLRSHLAAVDAITGEILDWNPYPEAPITGPPVSVVAAGPGGVYIGGGFTSLAGRPHENFAVFSWTGAPVIVQEPVGGIRSEGTVIILAVEIEGQSPLFYQWQFNGSDIPNAIGKSLILTDAQFADSGVYTVVVTNAVGYVSSSPVTLRVTSPLAISGSPQSQVVSSGNDVTFAASATGNPVPSYQWKLNGVVLPGETSASLHLTNVQAAQGGRYSVVVFNGSEAMESQPAELTVSAPVLPFADHFADRSSTNSYSGTGTGDNTGATVETAQGEPFHAGKPGGHSLWYSWLAPASGIVTFDTRGSTFDTLLAAYTYSFLGGLDEVVADDDRGGFHTSLVSFNAVAGTAYAIAIDGCFGSTGRVVLNWRLETTTERLPLIVTDPESQTVNAGSDAAFSVVVTTPTPLNYQWLHNGSPISGAVFPALLIPNVQPPHAGLYSVVVSNPNRAVESAAAALELGPTWGIFSRDKVEELLYANEADSPLNERFILIALGGSGRQIFDNTAATSQNAEPIHCGVPGGSSRWLRFRTESNGVVVLDTLGSSIDTVLAVYTGTNVATLSAVACDDNGAPDNARSLVRFQAVEGTDYLVAVDGVNAAQGRIHLNWKHGLPPSISTSTIKRVLRQGDDLTLTAGLINAVPAAVFQWQLDGQIVAGATNSALVLTNLQAHQSGAYSVTAINYAGGATQLVAIVTVATPIQLAYELIATASPALFRIQGFTPEAAIVEATTDLVTWMPVRTNFFGGPLDFIDSRSADLPARFYRVLTATTPIQIQHQLLPTTGRTFFRVRGQASPGAIIESTMDLMNWLPVMTNTSGGPIDFFDDATNAAARFYRVVPRP